LNNVSDNYMTLVILLWPNLIMIKGELPKGELWDLLRKWPLLLN
jgi:hypothetical protein